MHHQAASIAQSVLPKFLAAAPLLATRLPAHVAVDVVASFSGAAAGLPADLEKLESGLASLGRLVSDEMDAGSGRILLRATDAAEAIWLCSQKKPDLFEAREAAESALT